MSDPDSRPDHPAGGAHAADEVTATSPGRTAFGGTPPVGSAAGGARLGSTAVGSTAVGSTAVGSTVFPGMPLPGQPAVQQGRPPVPGPPTVGLPVVRPGTRQPATEERAPSFWDGDADSHHRDASAPAAAPATGRAVEPATGWGAEPDTGWGDEPATGWAAEPDGTGPVWEPRAPDPDPAPAAWSDRREPVRRPDTLAGLLLLLAGMVAGVSLLVVWVHGGGTGLDLVRTGVDDARSSAARLADTGSWQPLAVVAGGAVLFVLGLVLFTPARTHRFLGALALVVGVVVAAAVLVPLADARWSAGRFAVGYWLAVAVAVLGLAGGLKALMTGERLR